MSPRPRIESARPPSSKKRRTQAKRKNRPRPMPKMIEKSDKDDIAKRRTVMILDVLSGRTPVSEAIEKASISRGTYYQLESKALMAMLDALAPGETKTGPSPSMSKALTAAEDKADRLEQDKRRLERLLAMTTQVLKGPMTTKAGRRRRKKNSKPSSPNCSPSKTASKKTRRPKQMSTPPSDSTPTANGEAER